MMKYTMTPKAPRWISTESGNWAWDRLMAWRGKANTAMSVTDRAQLLAEAEQLHRQRVAPVSVAAS